MIMIMLFNRDGSFKVATEDIEFPTPYIKMPVEVKIKTWDDVTAVEVPTNRNYKLENKIFDYWIYVEL